MTPTIDSANCAIEQTEWTLPDRGRVGVLCLIATEFALFTIFVVAYVFYIGKSLTGPDAEPGVGTADLGDDLSVIQQHHGRQSRNAP